MGNLFGGHDCSSVPKGGRRATKNAVRRTDLNLELELIVLLVGADPEPVVMTVSLAS